MKFAGNLRDTIWGQEISRDEALILAKQLVEDNKFTLSVLEVSFKNYYARNLSDSLYPDEG